MSISPSGRKPSRSPFDSIRHVDENTDGTEFEYWSAREALGPLGYAEWRNMENVIRKAKSAARNSGNDPGDHFVDVNKMISIGKGGERASLDVHMTRFGMYLLAMNGDPDKPEIAAAQRYFVIQTRRAEVQLPELAPPHSPVVAPPNLPETPPANRPWAERFRRTFMPHVRDLHQKHPGCFSVVSATVSEIMFIEDEIVRHLMTTRGFDRPDISIGKRFSVYRREDLWLPETIRSACLWLPDQEISVDVKVYEGSEWPAFQMWFRDAYLTQHLGYYLEHKPQLKSYPQLTRLSAADNACRSLSGRQAQLPERVRIALQAAGGFAPAAPALPPGNGNRPRQLPPG